MRKEYIFALIFAILCFLGGNYYSTYNSKKRTLFVNKGKATEKETKDPFQDTNLYDSTNSENTGNRFKKGIIPDAETACKVAISIIKAVYGEQLLNSELPLQITLINDKYWTIEGTLHTAKGGVVFMTINKNNGCVLNLMHGE